MLLIPPRRDAPPYPQYPFLHSEFPFLIQPHLSQLCINQQQTPALKRLGGTLRQHLRRLKMFPHPVL
jgi:hypothetical protein